MYIIYEIVGNLLNETKDDFNETTNDFNEIVSFLNNVSLPVTPKPQDTCKELKSAFSNAKFLFPELSGIPETCIINAGVFVLFFVLFIFFKYYAWKRCVSGKVHVYQINLLQTLYGDIDSFILKGAPQLGGLQLKSHQKSVSFCRFLRWFYKSFRMSTNDIIKRCGNDTYLYLSFQKHLLAFYFLNSCIALCIILPANIFEKASRADGQFDFTQTTMAEVTEYSSNLWIHIFAVCATLLLVISIMRSFSHRLSKGDELAENSRKTLMISNLPRKFRKSIAIRRYFLNIYPESVIKNIKMVYHYRPLLKICEAMSKAEEALLFCNYNYKMHNIDIIVKKHCWCEFFYCHCDCGCAMGYGRQFYTQQIKDLHALFLRQLSKTIKSGPLKAFVSFTEADMTEIIRFAEVNKHKVLKFGYWILSRAPQPSNVLWNYISTKKSEHKFKICMVCTILFVLLFFVTTPAAIKNALQIEKKLKKTVGIDIAALLITVIGILIIRPLVDWVFNFIPFATRSSYEMYCMKVLYTLLVLCLLIMPVIGIASIYSAIDILKTQKELAHRYTCVFIAENGAFFVNYIITASFLSNISLLFRTGTMLKTVIRLVFSYSEADKIAIYKKIFCETKFGAEYALILLNFTIVNFYSTFIPVIAPFGFLYMFLRYFADKHTVYYSYTPTATSSEVHHLAIKFVYFNILFKNVGFFFLLLAKTAWNDERVIVMAIILIITAVIFIYNLDFDIFKSCHAYTSKKFIFEDDEEAELEMHDRATYFPEQLQAYMHVIDEI